MRSDHEWEMARRVARRVAVRPGRGMRRDELAASLDISQRELNGYIGLAYSRRMVDCIRDFVVAPPMGN